MQQTDSLAAGQVMMHLIDRKRDMAKVMAEANATWAGAESFIENQDGASNFGARAPVAWHMRCVPHCPRAAVALPNAETRAG